MLNNSFYVLSRYYGVRAMLRTKKVIPTEKDYLAGTQTETHNDPKRVSIVLLPVNYQVQERLREHRGDLRIGDRDFLIHGKYGAGLKDIIIYKSKSYEIVAFDTYDDEAMYGLLRNIQNES